MSSFTRTVGSILRNGRATVDRARTHSVIGGCFTRLRRGVGTTGVRTNGGFLRRGGGHRKIIALPDKLRCRIVARKGINRCTGTASRIRYRCRNALVSKALFSDSVGHNRPTAFNMGRIVPN